jgi:thiamine pyrophosphate-dependent acetolactate synthase large subunit-like protein
MPSKTTPSMMTVGDFLLRRSREDGISHLFDGAGDFNREFLPQMEDANESMWVGNCHEPNAACGADGYARLNGISGLIVTNGVGALSGINGEAVMDKYDTPSLLPGHGMTGNDDCPRRSRHRPGVQL